MLFEGVHRNSAMQRNWQCIPQPGCHCLKELVPWILRRSMKNRQQPLTRWPKTEGWSVSGQRFKRELVCARILKLILKYAGDPWRDAKQVRCVDLVPARVINNPRTNKLFHNCLRIDDVSVLSCCAEIMTNTRTGGDRWNSTRMIYPLQQDVCPCAYHFLYVEVHWFSLCTNCKDVAGQCGSQFTVNIDTRQR